MYDYKIIVSKSGLYVCDVEARGKGEIAAFDLLKDLRKAFPPECGYKLELIKWTKTQGSTIGVIE